MFTRLTAWGKGEGGRDGSKNGATGSLSRAVQSVHVNFPRSSQMAVLLELCMQHHDTEAR